MVFEERPLVTFNFSDSIAKFKSCFDESKLATDVSSLGVDKALLESACVAFIKADKDTRDIWLTWFHCPSDGILFKMIHELATKLCALESFKPIQINDLSRALVIVCSNSHSTETGGALYRMAAMLAHSCFPNMIYSTLAGERVIKALRPIEKAEMLSISYVGVSVLMLPTELRRGKIKCFYYRSIYNFI